ncbi:MAG: pyridoxine 5'-phosphate synthase [Euryhalocaulis sp.]|uniref:pyridoxine 5'-phosphate synthase n=1 Tax=Euryhalocaulis sp. TaxID=2744307 RepID=UPI00179826FE|nr:pyridoxine 5'-phosphate synthase [Euryhalocaulis sp.]MBA4802565.1 pyridoxine 5'-phosphate synthase [Euryhalocaulis sp.]
MSELPRLGVNIDHVATIRNARGGDHPDPVRAARLAAEAGAEGITAHLREDRRHIGDKDIQRLVDEIDLPLNLEMAATDEMVEIALRHRPPHCCIVPEKREERTTEGGLDAARHHNQLAPVVRRLREEGGIRVSLFIEPDPVQVAVASALGAEVVEFHTGRYVEHVFAGETKDSEAELDRIRAAAADGAGRGLEIHAGHGLTFDTVKPVAAIAEMRELNIGHFLMGEAIFIGLEEAIRRMKTLIVEARS